MKKLLLVLVSVLILFTMAFGLSACSIGGVTGGENNKSGNGSGASNKGGNVPGGNTQQEGVLATLGDNYKINLTYNVEYLGDTKTEQAVFMGKDGVCYYHRFYHYGDEVSMLIKDGHCYSFNEYVDYFSSCSTNDIEKNVESHDGWNKLIKISNNVSKIEFTGQENVTFLGRSCTKFINKKHVDAYYVVDNTTKLCLKYENKSTVYNELNSVIDEATDSFEVTEFVTGSANMDSIIAKLKFVEWVDSAYLTERGLSSVSAPVGEFESYNLNCDEDTKKIESYTGRYIMNEANVNALCSAFYNAGVKYEYDNYTTEKPIEEIYKETTDENGTPVDGYISFRGYTSTGGWVNIYGEKQDDGTYEVDISL